MITFDVLHKRIHQQYTAVLKACVLKAEIFPLYLRVNKTPDSDFTEQNQKLEALFQHSSHHHPLGYHILSQPVHSRKHGWQHQPVAFYFDTLERYLGYTQKQTEYDAFAADVMLLLQAFPVLKAWCAHHIRLVIDYHGKWPQLIQVLQYFSAHPMPQLFARALPLQGLGTKFVEQHKAILLPLLNIILPETGINTTYTGLSQFEQRFGLLTDMPRLRFRWLDTAMAHQYTGGLTDLTVGLPELAKQEWWVPYVLLVENKTNLLRAEVFLTLPQLQKAMAVFGSGRAAALLADIPWLLQARILYWGDMDAEDLKYWTIVFPAFRTCRRFVWIWKH